ncbi:hypothetical protein [Methylocella sp. CPCC 101449]|uniref:hypothetical protein n=1 Tax=Methylocella sp. CPCC 101449 TaxID=2987531 RepID=UPI00288CF80C|nr:hypothetical protein [Methylocella sp. CPCC 101449]MDT2024588.1 hypothetical protein [Methylocella sp. CPCC 101449]
MQISGNARVAAARNVRWACTLSPLAAWQWARRISPFDARLQRDLMTLWTAHLCTGGSIRTVLIIKRKLRISPELLRPPLECHQYIRGSHPKDYRIFDKQIGIKQRSKWDISRLAFDPVTVGARACGGELRATVRALL